ncbi:MAG: hypothetical protein RLZZ77_492 [Bacteroidota bacterium]
MKKILILLFVCISPAFFAQQAAFVHDQILIQLEKGISPDEVEREFSAQYGILPDFHIERLISEQMRVWLVRFDAQQLDAKTAVEHVSRLHGVSVAQVNHLIEERNTVPDDAFFGLQWHHVQSNDHDINSDLAWDITTGGTTATGDDIVVCVVETQGAKWDQVDIVDNHWINTNEIAGNGIDDDLNGYVDDVDGWNITNDTDNLSTGNHGTQVSSMIGAKGNNATGIAGVNWDVKIMQVQMGGISEANVIEAYSYPLAMRKLYNQTGGQKGAFVVATNSSWGTDYGQAANAPLWCAMYDTLGYYGVLSAGATANLNINVDTQGDLPTTCPSQYLISVTATNNADVRTFSGYGTTHIDLGAPGENVYLANNTNYGTTSGTSFASPCVAGGVALLYSVPCASFMQLAFADPAQAALNIKNYIMDGVTPISNLSSEVLSGGRMDLFASINLMLQSCSNSSCPSPYNITATQNPNSLDYTINWGSFENQSIFHVRYRETGGEWIETTNINAASFILSGLTACTTYEVEVAALCDTETSEWSNTFSFTTEGCCVNPDGITVHRQWGNEVYISWNPVFAAESYTIQVFSGADLVQTITSTTPEWQQINELTPCSYYNILVTSDCPAADEAVPFTLFTQGCTDCGTHTYCNVSANSASEWIANVQIGALNNSTESEPNGYGDYTDLGFQLGTSTTAFINVTPGYSGTAYSESIKAWIDYNGDGIFSDNELIFSPAPSNSMVSGSFTVPSNSIGAMTLRVAMSYNTQFGGGAPAVPCGTIAFGEVEDYCVDIQAFISVEEKDDASLFMYPNPADTQIVLAQRGVHAIYTLQGQKVISGQHGEMSTLDISSLAAGIYVVECNGQFARLVVE